MGVLEIPGTERTASIVWVAWASIRWRLRIVQAHAVQRTHIALFAAIHFEDPIATIWRRSRIATIRYISATAYARLARGRTPPSGFHLAKGIAAIIEETVGIHFLGSENAVIAVLAWVQFAVAA